MFCLVLAGSLRLLQVRSRGKETYQEALAVVQARGDRAAMVVSWSEKRAGHPLSCIERALWCYYMSLDNRTLQMAPQGSAQVGMKCCSGPGHSPAVWPAPSCTGLQGLKGKASPQPHLRGLAHLANTSSSLRGGKLA